jgi:hypothetical protein
MRLAAWLFAWWVAFIVRQGALLPRIPAAVTSTGSSWCMVAAIRDIPLPVLAGTAFCVASLCVFLADLHTYPGNPMRMLCGVVAWVAANMILALVTWCCRMWLAFGTLCVATHVLESVVATWTLCCAALLGSWPYRLFVGWWTHVVAVTRGLAHWIGTKLHTIGVSFMAMWFASRLALYHWIGDFRLLCVGT